MDSGNIAWLVTASALVLFMTPGVAFFYGGLVKAKSVVSMLMLSFGAMGLIGVLWVLYGANMASIKSGNIWDFSGNPFSDFGLSNGTGDSWLQALYGSTFAIITVALISGAIADRAKFGSWLIFAGVWASVVYFPVAAWVWGGGWIMNLGKTLFGADSGIAVIDYAGGTAVHINAGAAALALAIVLGRRVGFQKGFQKPHNVPLVVLGASILWFGWFGFNAGADAQAYDPVSGALVPSAMSNVGLLALNTLVATSAAILGWILIDKIRDGKATAVGGASGAVAGLVAITPACIALTPGWSIVLGAVVGIVCALAVDLKFKLGYDDSLDVVGVHLVGGLVGTLYLGFFATGSGLFVGGDGRQLVVQAIAAFSVLVYSFVVAFLVGFAIEKTVGFRIKNEDELAGIDVAVHGEEGYELV